MEQSDGDPPSEGCVPDGSAAQPVVDPRIGLAYGTNEQGRAAMNARHYKQARDLFQRAFAIYPDPVYKDNELIADAGIHFQHGLALMERNRWESAIAEFRRAEAIHRFDPQDSQANIRICLHNEWLDAYRNALAKKQYWIAINALEAAANYGHVNDLQGNIDQIRENWYWHDAGQYFDRKDWDLAQNYYEKALSLDPKNKDLLNLRALCVAHSAIDKAQALSSIADAAQVLGPAIQAFNQALQTGGSYGLSAQNRDWIRERARLILTKIAKRTGDWASLIQVHRQWASEAAPGDALAEKELAYVLDTRAYAASNHPERSQHSLREAYAAYQAAAAADPDNPGIQKNLAYERGQINRVRAMERVLGTMSSTDPRIGRLSRTSALTQLHAAAHSDPAGRCPWDSAAGCRKEVVRGGGSNLPGEHLTSPAHDSPHQRAVRQALLTTEKEVATLSAQLDKTHDPMDHAIIKAKLRQSQYDLALDRKKAQHAGIVLTVGRRRGPRRKPLPVPP